ncbi:3-deoxy-manno-octulosonate cytidylyltransferase [Aeromonas caviae]|uniref:3-deoxy-manno-octulosonate cytidylyltransferase n=1 Tax=Aeromonas caviae TaxID=648 RepID=UPI0029DAF6C6|nr:3-deoxy-manno-octulosonate cytidylyltransferase [Aeromonas caviae]MDX7814802.1 3-deoxy-manno-octulosonate cytidylyltransferase [Aeromonas caviae]
MSYKIVIPARYGSSRLPGKPLAQIGGQPMVWHVWQRALETGIPAGDIWVATDDQRIHDAVSTFGANVLMTSASHSCGTDRLAEVVALLGWADDEIVVNVQGDEPLLPAQLIQLAADTLAADQQSGIATLACPIVDFEQVMAPQCVKVVTNQADQALYFSRAPIPWDRDKFAQAHSATGTETIAPHWLRHIGLYAYRVSTLTALSHLPASPLEQLESLEQLRALWHGIKIAVARVEQAPPHGVDTPEDLARIQRHFASGAVATA